MILFWAPMMDFWTGDRNLPDFWFLYFGYNFVTAAGNAKAMNLASNLGGIAAFLFLGKVYFIYAIPWPFVRSLVPIWGQRLPSAAVLVLSGPFTLS